MLTSPQKVERRIPRKVVRFRSSELMLVWAYLHTFPRVEITAVSIRPRRVYFETARDALYSANGAIFVSLGSARADGASATLGKRQ